MKFAVSQQNKSDHEAQTIYWFCSVNRVQYRLFQKAKDVPPDFIPVGNVPWVTEVLGRPEVPDYYPQFLSSWLKRRVWAEEAWPYGERCFIKPADRHKRFTGFVKRVGWKGKKKGPFLCSEVVKFVSEWRWYVCRGKIVDARWGSGIEAPVPELGIEWPSNYSAAVDFGRLENGELALIESNSPFACGWYGPTAEGATYVQWLSDCWRGLKES